MMHLQSPLQNQNVSLSLSSSPCYSSSLPFKLSTHTLGQTQRVCYQRLSVTCSISKIHSYGTVDYERRPIWENEGKNLTKWELCRVVKELRKYRRHARALEVYEWMNNRPERFRVSASDTAIQLDLIAKVRGVSSAERFFLNLTEMKEKNVQLDIYSYNIWLSSSGSQGSVEKMEQVFEEMAKDPTIVPNWTTFSTMATMYIKMDQFEKAEECLRRMDDIEGAEQLYEEWVSVRSSNDARIGNLLIGWQSGFLKDEAYASLIGLPDATIGKGELSSTIDTEDRTDNIVDSENVDDDSQMLFNQLESSI
ncbi:Tetratricopeptide-like helical domain superfamily [Sesbania bispinosa]|nr:Tetratricopeptide-like helical domain superfamily [Sesbania bispinosa]